MAKKACVIHTKGKQAEADATSAKLQDVGYEVCMAEVTAGEAAAVKAGEHGSLPARVQDCLSGAELCLILVDDEVGLGIVAGLASDGGCRVVTVGGSPEDLPEELDDIIDGHLPSPDAPDFVDVIEGEPERVGPDNEPAPPRKPPRVKCQ
jgi:hypothetical protein